MTTKQRRSPGANGVSARNDAERHLSQMEGKYRGLLEAAPDAMVVVNEAGEIVLLNVQAEKQFGYRRDELLGQEVTNIIPEGFAERLIADDLRSAADALAQVIGTGIELTGLRKDRTEFPIEIMLSPLESTDGVLITAAIRNITKRKEAEANLAQMEGRYRGLLEAAPDAMVVVNQAGEIVLLNVQAEKQFGYSRDELLDQKVTNIIPEGFAERLIADDLRSAEDALAQQIGAGIELTGRRKDGTEFPIEIMLSPLESAEGILVTAAIRDISVRKDAEKHLAQMEGKYRGLLEAAPDAMVVVNQAGEIVLLNVQAEKQFGYRRDELLDQKVTNIIPEGFAERLIADDLRSAEEALAQQIETGIELTARRKDGTNFPIEIMLSPLESAEGTLVTAAIRNISARKDAEETVKFLAYHDALTNLPNRALLEDRLNMALARALRNGQTLVVAYVDIDHFKVVNDTLGHSMGDLLLIEIAERLTGAVRLGDTVARVGGDEFVVLLVDLDSVDDGMVVIERIRGSLRRPCIVGDDMLQATASLGVSVFPLDGVTTDDLLQNADTAMYRAKESGRDNCQLFTRRMGEEVQRRLTMKSDLRRAVDLKEFAVHYQPVVNLGTGQISGCEALVRWNNPKRGLVPPYEFIELAEDMGLIVALGDFVLQTACRQFQDWLAAGLSPASIAVNLSSHRLQYVGLEQSVLSVLRETGLDPSNLQLEITEGVLIGDMEHVVSVLQSLRNMGIRISIDDFGTGYSSLSYLRHLPIDSVKVDQSFVAGIPSQRDDLEIVSAIVALAHKLQLHVIAEGIETEEQARFLVEQGCEEAQGYLFSRPVPAEDFGKLLSTGMPLWDLSRQTP